MSYNQYRVKCIPTASFGSGAPHGFFEFVVIETIIMVQNTIHKNVGMKCFEIIEEFRKEKPQVNNVNNPDQDYKYQEILTRHFNNYDKMKHQHKIRLILLKYQMKLKKHYCMAR